MAFFSRPVIRSLMTLSKPQGHQSPSSLKQQWPRIHNVVSGRGPFLISSHRYSTQKKNETKAFMSWKSVLIGLTAGGSIIVFMMFVKNEKMEKLKQERTRQLGEAKIGGMFDLIDHNGVPRTAKDFRGKWVLLYFGFTHCPDICPDELEKMAKVIDELEKKHPEVALQPLFITVDPERDTKEAVKSYLEEFHPKILGLTGTTEQVAQATKAYRVYFSAGPRDKEEDYIVDHTVIMYLINPDGDFIDYYGQTRTAKQIATAINLQSMKFDRSNKGGFFGLFGK